MYDRTAGLRRIRGKISVVSNPATEMSESMPTVLSIRDPKSGALIAEERILPDEDKDSALARIYQKTLGPDAPEQAVITKSIWLDDRSWAAELLRDWGDLSSQSSAQVSR